VSLVSDVNVDQIEALAGGHLLQKRVFNQENDTRQITARMLSRATQRLASALQQVCLFYYTFNALYSTARSVAAHTMCSNTGIKVAPA
jgi:hypothetical protein